jgi:Tfp pilus assembly protein PilO
MKNVLAIFLIIASIGIFYALIEPTYAEIQKAREEKASYDKALNDSQEVAERQAVLGTKYNEMPPSEVERLEKFLPDGIDNIRLIIEIDKIAQQYNMTLRDPQVSEKQPEAVSIDAAIAESSGLQALYGIGEMRFSVKGTYESYLAFIKDLEKSLRLINITAVSLSGASAETDSVDLYNFETTIKTYWLKK